jgi:hypothetical protein
MQVADRLNSMGVPCDLVTGQEVRRVKGARHTACTVEMAGLSTRVDVSGWLVEGHVHAVPSVLSASGLYTPACQALWTDVRMNETHTGGCAG